MRLWILIVGVVLHLNIITPVEKLWKSCGKLPISCGKAVENSTRVLRGVQGITTTTTTISIPSLLHNYNCRYCTKVVDAEHNLIAGLSDCIGFSPRWGVGSYLLALPRLAGSESDMPAI